MLLFEELMSYNPGLIRVIHKVIGSFGVRYFKDSLYAVSLSVTGKYPKFAKIPHP